MMIRYEFLSLLGHFPPLYGHTLLAHRPSFGLLHDGRQFRRSPEIFRRPRIVLIPGTASRRQRSGARLLSAGMVSTTTAEIIDIIILNTDIFTSRATTAMHQQAATPAAAFHFFCAPATFAVPLSPTARLRFSSHRLQRCVISPLSRERSCRLQFLSRWFAALSLTGSPARRPDIHSRIAPRRQSFIAASFCHWPLFTFLQYSQRAKYHGTTSPLRHTHSDGEKPKQRRYHLP